MAHDLLTSSDRFYNLIAEKASFDMATCKPKFISEQLRENYNHLRIEVHTYYKKFTRALAYFDPRYPNRIYINAAKLGRSLGSIAASVVHEIIHLLDKFIKGEYFGHGDNSAKGKQNTAPYWIDNLAEALVDGKKPDFNNNESSRIVYRRSFFSRVKRFFRRLF